MRILIVFAAISAANAYAQVSAPTAQQTQFGGPLPARPIVAPPTQYQFVNPPIQNSTSQNEQKLPQELLAILQSLFGGGSKKGTSNSGCKTGVAEFACVDSNGNESYSPESFANARPTSSSDLNSPFAILGPFKKYFDGCVEKAGLGACRFVNLGVKGDASHQARRSCHNSAQAIDVGPLTCMSGRKVLASDPKYFEVAKCMAGETNNELEVIFYKTEGPNMIRKSDHNQHMHIQLKNCSMVYG